MVVRAISVAQARSVRLPVLRPGLPPDSAVLDHDEEAATFHLGAFENGQLIGVATFFEEPCPARSGPAFRLRGMATLPHARRRGAGRALVDEGTRVAREAGASWMWCEGRVSAQAFYERLGFAAVGELFWLAPGGQHYLMVKPLGEGS